MLLLKLNEKIPCDAYQLPPAEIIFHIQYKKKDDQRTSRRITIHVY